MASRVNIWGACRSLALRPRPARIAAQSFRSQISSTRFYADDATNKPSSPPSGNSSASGSISESRPGNANARLTNELAQDASAGTVSSSSQARPSDALDDAALEQILYGGRPVTSQREGGLTEAQEEALYREGVIPPPEEAEAVLARSEAAAESQSIVSIETDVQKAGHKFGLPQKPYPEGFHVKKRYHPVLEQITRLLMRHGELSVAQRNMATVMNYLRTAPAPIYSPKFPLLPGTPPASHLPLNPVLYITIAIDSVAPLLKVRNIAGAGGGGRALELPVPLAVRQRRRMAFQWILDVINKKPSKGSGRNQFAHRIAEEIIAVVEGRSSVWEKRKLVHKLGTAARANVGSNKLKAKKKK
ncbi:ribosomal protein S7 [Trichoderma reesei RUT C-30]|uniref:Small ribosomal subunit protein uS7m n=1 Tax=Hypocrea jecorina (strain ATCC 56765 / BCRC 32924 / NRRL 11460 / Rut C-30) TaxID=1344414 RepID=A0A024S5X9_HYPJR|nr:ribosomal protein S7 [Trichoderma reesei RUT C-30]